MPNLTEQQIAAARAGVARAKEHYRSFDMNTWTRLDSESPCGTVGCFAFEVCAANGQPLDQFVLTDYCVINGEIIAPWEMQNESPALNDNRFISVEKKAFEILGQYAVSLFYTSRWPHQLYTKFKNAPEYSYERTLILEEVVEEWIKNDGRFDYNVN